MSEISYSLLFQLTMPETLLVIAALVVLAVDLLPWLPGRDLLDCYPRCSGQHPEWHGCSEPKYSARPDCASCSGHADDRTLGLLQLYQEHRRVSTLSAAGNGSHVVHGEHTRYSLDLCLTGVAQPLPLHD